MRLHQDPVRIAVDSLGSGKIPIRRHLVAGFGGGLLLVVLQLAPAQAQLSKQLDGLTGGGESSKGSMLGGLGGSAGGLPSVGQASAGNTAGILQYCVRNNYVSGDAASSVKNSLMSKVGGSSKQGNDSGFAAGDKGMLQTGGGQSYSLGGSGIKEQATHKVCDMVLQHAKSML